MVGHYIIKGNALFCPYRYSGQLYPIIYGQATPSVIGEKSETLTICVSMCIFLYVQDDILTYKCNKASLKFHRIF